MHAYTNNTSFKNSLLHTYTHMHTCAHTHTHTHLLKNQNNALTH